MSTYVPDASALPLRWTVSSYSGGRDNCVEVARFERETVAVRDSEDPSGPALLLRADEWTAFIADIRAGEFDLL
ncbi:MULTISPECIES: DUF397 domain-containing protein [Streptomyces]|uniref:DUF397 domain-containing protein n=1 Tax=Streptomyces TaxID=1883 RepID=UPI0002E37476|nr:MULTISPECIES: DUF397 domain-containing protein [Streptomyces]MCC3655131.1 DUF397 domain-containing protein [Streptomyces sp. S07_1.15]MZE76970.1 DUF397 domain-containing protein [Streptomyces sp. SID5475]WSQ70541.1 DUF397 domain-containing protein [Streptomyces xinghaiensis]